MSEFYILNHYPFDISQVPTGWATASVRELCGEPQPGFACGVHNRIGQGVVHLRPMNIDTLGRISLGDVKYVAGDELLRVQHGDVLFNNTNSPAWVGKTAPIIRPSNWAFSNHMTRLRPANGVDSRFLAAQLQFLQDMGYFRHLCVNHVNQASIGGDVIGDAVPVLVAPEHEQSRIADRLDELFTDLSAGVAALERVKKKLKRYRSAVLHAAVTGRLTAGWRKTHAPPAEPADKLLARILIDRRKQWEQRTLAKYAKEKRTPPKNWQARYVEPAPPKTGDLPKLLHGWCWSSVSQLSSKVADGVHKKPNYVPTGVPFVTVRNLTAGPGISFGRLNYITREDHYQFILRADPERGDVLVSKDGTLGVIRLIDVDTVFSIFVSVALGSV